MIPFQSAEPDPVSHRIISKHWWRPPPNAERRPNGTALAMMLPSNQSRGPYSTTQTAATVRGPLA